MNPIARVLLGVSVVAIGATILAFAVPVEPAPVGGGPGATKIVELICKPGWRAGAGGQYGGVPFDVTCNNGRGRARVTGFSGSTYTVRMGVEGSSIALDCFFSGDSATVNETCGVVGLSIR